MEIETERPALQIALTSFSCERMLSLAPQEVSAVSRPGEPGPARLSVPSVLSARTENDLLEKALRNCRIYLGGSWNNVHFSDIRFLKISGGLSNLLFSCELPDEIQVVQNEPRKVLVRFYGQVNRQRAKETLTTECVILTLLSERQQGPRLYGVFDEGRIEEYIPARSLLNSELSIPRVSCVIAEKLAAVHTMEVPMDKNPTRLWESIEQWMERIDELIEQDPGDDHNLELMVDKLKSLRLRSELSWLRMFLKEVRSPVVFCHNDLQEGNILLRVGDSDVKDDQVRDLNVISPDDLVIIDYEYCSYNNRGFDLANHFNEWKYDYKNDSPPYFWERSSEDEPSHAQKEVFVRAYLAKLKTFANYKFRVEDTVEHLMLELEYYSLMSSIFWALWSVVSSLSLFSRSIQFDYWCFGERKLEDYYKQKEKMIVMKIDDF